MYCTNCGKEIANDSKFCTFCGSPIKSQTVNPAQHEEPRPAQPRVSSLSRTEYSAHEPQEMVSFGKAISTCFSKYATFTGRAQRSEYWWWYLFEIIVTFCGGFIDGVLGTAPILTYVVYAAFIIPTLAVGVRRCHDTNHSGWWLLCPFYNFVLMLLPSDTGVNEYGE